ncbi:uncharacterized protein [Drosophila pseudoobscura]|uniref:Uncharacterized protein isoform X2 n=1 Tax=Drosophila pseudoobscura pseudoobscura TaxID=46245 RepID=A0A6I8WEC7_DROPS|nr:uncharacterized protein LOC26533359 isoform X2 [Drosophila pseudoobscura]
MPWRWIRPPAKDDGDGITRAAQVRPPKCNGCLLAEMCPISTQRSRISGCQDGSVSGVAAGVGPNVSCGGCGAGATVAAAIVGGFSDVTGTAGVAVTAWDWMSECLAAGSLAGLAFRLHFLPGAVVGKLLLLLLSLLLFALRLL